MHRLSALIALAAVAALAFTAWLAERPPTPAGPDAPATSFSAARAWPHLERIASGGPTPIGSPGGRAVRDYLVAELRELGLKPEVQRAIGAHAFGHQIVSGLAENVVAVVPGRASTGRVLLAAHYDSTPTTPGTSDDKASVAAILEIARALKAGPPPRNDVVLLLSDGEEPGLIGAEAFSGHPLARDGGVMINLEGPGNAAPSSVYNVTPGGAGLVAAFARAVPYPVGESAVIGAYRSTGFHSDLSALEEHGFVGMDLGLADGRAYYHHPRDTVAALDRGALQMQGDNALAAVREVAEADLPALREPREEVFFALFRFVVRYPGWLVTPLAVLALAAVAGLAVLCRVRGGSSVPRLLGGVAAALLPPVVAGAVVMGLWDLLTRVEPGYAALVSDPYRPGPFRLAVLAIAVAVVWAWHALLRRRLGPDALVVGALAWQAVIGVAGAALLPGTSYYGAIPALAGALGCGAALLLRERRPLLALAAQAAGAAPGVVLFTVGARSVGSAMGMAMAAPMAVFSVFAAMAALPLLAAATPRRAAVPPLLAGVLAVALACWGLAVNRFGPDQPRVAHLAYVLDAGKGTWVSTDAAPHPWAAALVPDTPATWDKPTPYGTVPVRTGPAPAVDVPAPELTILDERREGDQLVLRLRARSFRGAHQIGLYTDADVRGGSLKVPGSPSVPLPSHDRFTGAWPYELEFFAPPASGVEIELRVRGTARPRLAVTDLTLGLGDIPGHRPRPRDVDLSPFGGGLPTDSVTVVGTPAGGAYGVRDGAGHTIGR